MLRRRGVTLLVSRPLTATRRDTLHRRIRLVVAITLGQVVAYAIGAAFAHVTHGWRYMVGLGAAPAALSLVTLFWLPESPRILLRNDRREPARTVLRKMYASATDEQLGGELRLLEAGVQQAKKRHGSSSFWSRLVSIFAVATNRRALGTFALCGCESTFAPQLKNSFHSFHSLQSLDAASRPSSS